MAISRVPGYSLLANLDRQGTDIGITSSGLYVTYWDVVNYRFGINTAAPQQALEVNGNILTANGHVYTNANIAYDIGALTNWWSTVYAQNIQSANLTGTILTNVQPNITSLGTLSTLDITGNAAITGNLSVTGNLIVNGINAANVIAGNITADVFGNLTGFVLQPDQPFITSTGNLTVANINITGGNLNVLGNGNFTTLQAQTILQNGSLLLDTNTNIQVTGDVVGYGTYNSINLQLNITGVTEGTFGSSSEVAQFFVNEEGRILSAANVAIDQVGNLYFNDTTISSNNELTITTTTNGNIYLDAGTTGIVQILGTDALGLPAGDNSERPLYPIVGYTRFNTASKTIEYYDGTNWIAPGQATISSEVINPDGVSNTYPLSSNTTSSGVLVSINGTLQQPGYSYDIVNNNQIQFTEVPLVSDTVEVRLMAPSAVTVGALRFGTYTEVSLDTQSINIKGNIQTTGFYNNKANLLIPNVSVTTVDSYSTTSYRTAKYVLQAVQASDVESYEFLVTHNGTTAVSTTYGVLTIGNTLGNISATLSSGNVEVQYTPFTANTYLTVSRNFYPL
jgi:hypothetical protein